MCLCRPPQQMCTRGLMPLLGCRASRRPSRRQAHRCRHGMPHGVPAEACCGHDGAGGPTSPCGLSPVMDSATPPAACLCLVQELGSAEVLKEQACYLPCSDDGLPVIGRVPGLENAYVATAHSCWGILNAPATGEALAELIVQGAATSSSLSAFDPGRPRLGAGARR